MLEVPAVVEDVPTRPPGAALRDEAQWGEWEDGDMAGLLEEPRATGSTSTCWDSTLRVHRWLAAPR